LAPATPAAAPVATPAVAPSPAPVVAASPEPVMADAPTAPVEPEPPDPVEVPVPQPIVADAAPDVPGGDLPMVTSPAPSSGDPSPEAPPVAIGDAVDAIAAIEATEPDVVVPPTPTDPPLEGYLASGDPSIRKRGIKNLAYRTDIRSRQLLGRMLRDDPDPSVRRFAWITIVDLIDDNDAHVSILQDHAGWQLQHGEENLAMQAARALRSRGSRPGLLVPGLRRRSLDIRLATLDAVEDLPPEDRVTLRSEVERLLGEGNAKLERRASDVLSLMD
ncbi:MAG: hypothetical protein AAF602_05110, partial [Myxococcota bacterium]